MVSIDIGISKLLDNLFGKSTQIYGDKISNFTISLIEDNDSVFNKLMNLPYIRYSDQKEYYSKILLRDRDLLLRENGYKEFMKYITPYFNWKRRRYLIKNLISNNITSFNEADRTIIGLILLFPYLRKNDVIEFIENNKDNEQSSFKIKLFIKELYKEKPQLINKRYLQS